MTRKYIERYQPAAIRAVRVQSHNLSTTEVVIAGITASGYSPRTIVNLPIFGNPAGGRLRWRMASDNTGSGRSRLAY